MKNIKIRVPMYFIGLFIMIIGIAISVKSNLGVSPVSSIPYTMTCVWGIEMGKATILFHCALVILQIVILRKNFKLVDLLQIAFGIFLYMPANIIPLAGEGVMQAISDTTRVEFSKVKITFDVSMVLISVIVCLIMIHSFGSVGIGTIAAALLVGIVLGIITKLLGDKRDLLLNT